MLFFSFFTLFNLIVFHSLEATPPQLATTFSQLDIMCTSGKHCLLFRQWSLDELRNNSGNNKQHSVVAVLILVLMLENHFLKALWGESYRAVVINTRHSRLF